ncbi:hypothetical protein CCACVL1_10830 [Corchorus capsularis]|uniref:Glabrous enhancer-binding protein-like DBD domain-containing protein n=1 Tax=Corchorus capsularis TaxID=210143 RepID=A0A1R3IP91_COCAP|nr:hypothetical protein CCACVL1_10830 [Corchorus capsularis]
METPPPRSPNGQFSRVFSESDEIQILKSLIKATKSLPSPITTIAAEIVDRIAERLNYKFTSSQINGKIRKLKTKYHKHAKSKSLVRTHHDRKVFKLSKRIWGKKTAPKKKNETQGGEIGNGKADDDGVGNLGKFPVAAQNEESRVVDGVGNLEKFPYLVAEFSRVLPENEVWKERMNGFDEKKLRKMDQEWVALKVEEAKLVAKKAELMQQQIMMIMGEAGSTNGLN